MSVAARIATPLALVLFLSGCAYALHPFNDPGPEKLLLVTDRDGQYVIRIGDLSETAVAAGGRVVVEVPAFRGCSTYLFGFIKIREGHPERVRVIEVLRDGRVVRRLSLRALHRLPLDASGYRVIRL